MAHYWFIIQKGDCDSDIIIGLYTTKQYAIEKILKLQKRMFETLNDEDKIKLARKYLNSTTTEWINFATYFKNEMITTNNCSPVYLLHYTIQSCALKQ